MYTYVLNYIYLLFLCILLMIYDNDNLTIKHSRQHNIQNQDVFNASLKHLKSGFSTLYCLKSYALVHSTKINTKYLFKSRIHHE